jgi:hypothetical protein
MTIAARLLLLLSVLLVTGSSLFAKAWHGIEPLRSTRSDVIRVLSQCSDQKEACVFTVENEDVYILFSGGLSQKYSDCTERLPTETVMFIESRPHSGAAFQEFQFAKREFIEFSLVGSWRMKHPVRYRLYVNSNDGLALKTREGKVVQVVYLPPPAAVPRCANYYDAPESFVDIYRGHVPFVTVLCPKDPVFEQQQIVIQGVSDFATRRGFEWTASDGKIITGQHTTRIIVDTTGLVGKVIKIGAEVNDFDLGLIAISTCELRVLKKP